MFRLAQPSMLLLIAGVLAVVAALAVAGVARADRTFDIPFNSCPAGVADAGGQADGDGRAATVDFQYDINGVAAGRTVVTDNGELGLWCINGKYFALEFRPNAGAVFRFIGKCPFEGGANGPTDYVLNDAGTLFVSTKWRSEDRGLKDDDGDGKLDAWLYTYAVGANTVTEDHFEDGALVGDGAAAHAPAVRAFTFGDLLPRDERVDDPRSVSEGGAGGCGGEDGFVGGIAEPVTLGADVSASAAGGGGPSACAVGAIAGGAAAAAVLAAAGGWYARRRSMG